MAASAGTGHVQYAVTGSEYSTAVCGVMGGSWGQKANLQKRKTIRGSGIWTPGLKVPTVNLNLWPVDANGFLGSILRASYPAGGLTENYLEVGDENRGIRGASWVINTAELSAQTEGLLAVNYEFMLCGKPATTSGNKTPTPVTTYYEWYTGVLTVGSKKYRCRSISIKVNNNVIPCPTLDDKATDEGTYPDGYALGDEEVEISAEFESDLGINLFDTDARHEAGSIVVALTNTAYPASTCTITAVTPPLESWESAFVDGNTVRTYVCNFVLDDNSGDLTIAIA